jgi:hypothetical protein
VRSWKWRIILPVAIVLLSIGLSPFYFQGILAHSFSLFFVSTALNIVPATVFNGSYPWQQAFLRWMSSYWKRFGFWEYQFLVFLFWLWVGWKIDLKVASRDCARTWTIAEIILALACSLMAFQFRAGVQLPSCPNAIPRIAIAWSVILVSYAVFRLSQLRRNALT